MENGTGYLDGAVIGGEAPVLRKGQCVTTIDDFGRSVVVIGTGPDGNLVVFQRFTGNKEDGVLVCNEPVGFASELAEAFPEASVSSRVFEKDMGAACRYIADQLVNTSTGWSDFARHLAPWSVA